MIRLKTAMNHKGGIVEEGTVLQLPPEVEEALVAGGNAERFEDDAAQEEAEEPKKAPARKKAEVIASEPETADADGSEGVL